MAVMPAKAGIQVCNAWTLSLDSGPGLQSAGAAPRRNDESEKNILIVKDSQMEKTVDGSRVDQLGKSELAQLRLHKIGFVFQAYNLIPVLTARENVEFVMQLQGIAATARGDKAMQILKEVGLEGLENRRPRE